MELQEFISKALAEIAAGVSEGRQEAQKHGVQIGQALYSGSSSNISTKRGSTPIPEFIEFDIAVSVSTGTEAKAGIRVIGIFGKLEGGAKQESVSRLRFKVPVHWEKASPTPGMTVQPYSTVP